MPKRRLLSFALYFMPEFRNYPKRICELLPITCLTYKDLFHVWLYLSPGSIGKFVFLWQLVLYVLKDLLDLTIYKYIQTVHMI